MALPDTKETKEGENTGQSHAIYFSQKICETICIAIWWFLSKMHMKQLKTCMAIFTPHASR